MVKKELSMLSAEQGITEEAAKIKAAFEGGETTTNAVRQWYGLSPLKSGGLILTLIQDEFEISTHPEALGKS